MALHLCRGTASLTAFFSEKAMKQRGPIFIMVTNFTLSFGTPFACILYLIVFQAAGGLNSNLSTVWRTVFGISCLPPLAVFYFRLKMMNSKLYRKVSQGLKDQMSETSPVADP